MTLWEVLEELGRVNGFRLKQGATPKGEGPGNTPWGVIEGAIARADDLTLRGFLQGTGRDAYSACGKLGPWAAPLLRLCSHHTDFRDYMFEPIPEYDPAALRKAVIELPILLAQKKEIEDKIEATVKVLRTAPQDAAVVFKNEVAVLRPRASSIEDLVLIVKPVD